MSNSIPENIFFFEKQFNKALLTLEQAIGMEDNVLVKDAVIQRYEYTFELSWKLMKSILKYQGVELTFSREILKESFAVGWINDALIWDNMLIDRNLTSHVYQENKADESYQRIVNTYFNELVRFSEKIKEVIRGLDTLA
jgi:nucleotidyltransferase substrate binding protein (TIGR01987 family)